MITQIDAYYIYLILICYTFCVIAWVMIGSFKIKLHAPLSTVSFGIAAWFGMLIQRNYHFFLADKMIISPIDYWSNLYGAVLIATLSVLFCVSSYKIYARQKTGLGL